MMLFGNIILISCMYMHGMKNDLRVKMMYLFNVPSIGEDFVVSDREFVRS
jgi:hypothetical protein